MAKARGVKKAAAAKPLTHAQTRSNPSPAIGRHRIPFTYKLYEQGQWVISDADGKPAAVCPGNEPHAAFIVRACNNFSALKDLARLARGEVEWDYASGDDRSPYRGVSLKAMQELFVRLDREVLHD